MHLVVRFLDKIDRDVRAAFVEHLDERLLVFLRQRVDNQVSGYRVAVQGPTQSCRLTSGEASRV